MTVNFNIYRLYYKVWDFFFNVCFGKINLLSDMFCGKFLSWNEGVFVNFRIEKLSQDRRKGCSRLAFGPKWTKIHLICKGDAVVANFMNKPRKIHPQHTIFLLNCLEKATIIRYACKIYKISYKWLCNNNQI